MSIRIFGQGASSTSRERESTMYLLVLRSGHRSNAKVHGLFALSRLQNSTLFLALAYYINYRFHSKHFPANPIINRLSNEIHTLQILPFVSPSSNPHLTFWSHLFKIRLSGASAKAFYIESIIRILEIVLPNSAPPRITWYTNENQIRLYPPRPLSSSVVTSNFSR